MSTPMIGEIRIFAFDFAPKNWAACNGQLLAIAQNQALFSILGTAFGGDGRVTFGLPDLRSRVAVHWGQGAGLSNWTIGEKNGSENVTLDLNSIPAHNHNLAPVCNNNQASVDATSPIAGFPGSPDANNGGYALYAASPTAGALMQGSQSSATGGGQPHTNLQPTLAVNFAIALQGTFPSRN